MGIHLTWQDISEPADQQNYFETHRLEGKLENQQYHFISGDNYPVLKFLLPQLKEKIDLIYIDPPYNTGKKSFCYNDSLYVDGVSSYLATDRHSAWLSFMSRRLKLAREMLNSTGCIFIAIGQEELHYLKLLCDQIFGEENFINDFMWLHGKGKKDTFSRTMQQSNLCYAKDFKSLRSFLDYETTSWAVKNPDNDPRGNWFSGSISFSEDRSNSEHRNYYTVTSPSGIKWQRQWMLSEQEMNDLISQNKIYFGTAPEFDNVPRKKIFNGEKNPIIPKNIIDGAKSTRAAQNHVDELLGIKHSFDNPKPVDLIEHLIQITNMPSDITVMDFFAGSGTTLEAVYNLNKMDNGTRKCILIQKPEEITDISKGFNTLSDLCLARCKKVLQNEEINTLRICNEN